MPGCRAPSSISHGCHTDSKVPPTRRGRSRLHSKPPALFYYSSATLTPTPSPDARCADALTPLRQSANHFTHSESAYGLEQWQVGLLSEVQAPRQKACRYVPPRHLPFALILCRHSEFPAFLWLTSLPLRAAPSSPHIAIVIHLALINLHRGKAECCRKGQFPRCGNLTFTAAILPPVLHIAVGRKRVGAKTRFSAVGGVQCHYGGKPP